MQNFSFLGAVQRLSRWWGGWVGVFRFLYFEGLSKYYGRYSFLCTMYKGSLSTQFGTGVVFMGHPVAKISTQQED